MIPFQAAGWDDPEELFRSQGFRLPVDPESQVAVLFADTEPKDFLQVQEAADDILPLFVVNRFDVARVVLRFFNSSVWIVKQDFSRRCSGENLPARVGNEREDFHKNIS